MTTNICQYVSKCTACQFKKKRLKYGKMPPKEAETLPWSQLCVDTVGPYRVRCKGKPDMVFQAVTFINPATGWFKIKKCKTKKADEVLNLAEPDLVRTISVA